MTTAPLDVVLCWHMHQPSYHVDDRFIRPWVYLHALKDYADMAAHLEEVPEARATVNFVPVLLEQIEAYARSMTAHRLQGAPLPDALPAALAAPAMPQDVAERARLIAACRKLMIQRATRRFPRYAQLASLAAAPPEELAGSAGDAFLEDLLVWTHLVWFGEHDRRREPRLRRLIELGGGFGPAHRRELMDLVEERLTSILPRYAKLIAAGRVEPMVSPWAHPILPLLLDLNAAREALPRIELPREGPYPHGEVRARWHLSQALASMQRCFGTRPRGCWPPEQAISSRTLELLDELGFEWTVSSGAVLAASLHAGGQRSDCVHRPFVHAGKLQTFFRDDGLSDLIGFTYKDWAAEDAVRDLIEHLLRIRQHCRRSDAVTVLALDGENAWEYYEDNGYAFLSALYRALTRHPELRLTTFADHCERKHPPARLDTVVSGSWVHGTLSTWIGHPDKNRAWELLIHAKRHFDAHGAPPPELERLLGICEGSDWFWWLGDDHSAESVASFEELYRAHLGALYRALGESPPDELADVLSRGQRDGIAHTMRPTS